MKLMQCIFALCLIPAASLAAAAAEDALGDQHEFKGKVLVVELEDRSESYVLDDAALKIIGGRPFLHGTPRNDEERNGTAKKTVAIAWDKVVVVTLFESWEAYRGRNAWATLPEPSIDFKIDSLRHQVTGLDRAIQHGHHRIAKMEIEMKEFEAKASKAETERAKSEYEVARRRRQKELQVIKKTVADAISKKDALEEQVERLHDEILQGDS